MTSLPRHHPELREQDAAVEWRILLNHFETVTCLCQNQPVGTARMDVSLEEKQQQDQIRFFCFVYCEFFKSILVGLDGLELQGNGIIDHIYLIGAFQLQINC